MFTALELFLGTTVPQAFSASGQSQIFSSNMSGIKYDPVLYNREIHSQGSWSDLDAFDTLDSEANNDTKVATEEFNIHSLDHSINFPETILGLFGSVADESNSDFIYTQTDPISGLRHTPLLTDDSPSTNASRSLPASPSSSHVSRLPDIPHVSETISKTRVEPTSEGYPTDARPSPVARERKKKTRTASPFEYTIPPQILSNPTSPMASANDDLANPSGARYMPSAGAALDQSTVSGMSSVPMTSPLHSPVETYGGLQMVPPKRRAAFVAEQKMADIWKGDAGPSDHVARKVSKRKVEDDYTPETPTPPPKRPRVSATNGKGSTSGGKIRCECGQTFGRPNDLERHLRTTKSHSNGSGFACSICGKVISRKDALNRHYKKCSVKLGNEIISSTPRKANKAGGRRKTKA